jgi:hypothetical protein
LHVLVEQRGAAGEFFGRVVFLERADDRAFRECGLLRECSMGERGGCGAESQGFQCLAAGQT